VTLSYNEQGDVVRRVTFQSGTLGGRDSPMVSDSNTGQQLLPALLLEHVYQYDNCSNWIEVRTMSTQRDGSSRDWKVRRRLTYY